MPAGTHGGAVSGASPKAMHLLIADDHVLFRSGFKLLVSELFPGVLLADAGDANEAWDVLNTDEAFDLVFLDLNDISTVVEITNEEDIWKRTVAEMAVVVRESQGLICVRSARG